MAANVRRPVDRWLVLFALALVAVGMVWIYSASAIKASQNHAAATAFLTRQLVGGAIGIVFMLALSQVDLTPLQDHPRPLQVAYGLLPNLSPGAKEQHPHVWREATAKAIKAALKQAKARASQVKAIGVSGQQHGFVPLDAKGEVIRPAKLWCDTAAAPEAS